MLSNKPLAALFAHGLRGAYGLPGAIQSVFNGSSVRTATCECTATFVRTTTCESTATLGKRCVRFISSTRLASILFFASALSWFVYPQAHAQGGDAHPFAAARPVTQGAVVRRER